MNKKQTLTFLEHKRPTIILSPWQIELESAIKKQVNKLDAPPPSVNKFFVLFNFIFFFFFFKIYFEISNQPYRKNMNM